MKTSIAVGGATHANIRGMVEGGLVPPPLPRGGGRGWILWGGPPGERSCTGGGGCIRGRDGVGREKPCASITHPPISRFSWPLWRRRRSNTQERRQTGGW